MSQVEAELHKEVDELKVRLQMAAEHYKEKYRECQKLRKQVKQLSQQPRIPPPESPDQVESDVSARHKLSNSFLLSDSFSLNPLQDHKQGHPINI